jgi:ZIP family zinc transporter
MLQAFVATLFTWSMTALGASLVFTAKDFNKRILDGTLGFAAGVMIAASFWSLLAPALEMAQDLVFPAWVPAAAGFLLGGIFLRSVDAFLPHLHLGAALENAEGVKTSWRRSTLLVLAITLHNIPEGMAVGVAFGAVAAGVPSATMPGAVALAIGIGIQNFPEGLAISMPLRREGLSRWKSFWYGQLSAVVEPVAAVIGAGAVLMAQPILPYALSFAAGAMIFVVVEELIPESQREGNADLATMGAMIGFAVMMILDVALS